MIFLKSAGRPKVVITLMLALLSGVFGFTLAKFWHGSNSIFISGRNPVAQLAGLVFDGQKLIGESQDQVNVLLLGVGGEGHDGPYLSDTVMLASIKPNTSEISLISIPRDIIVSIPGSYGLYKINSAYAYGVMNYGQKIGLTQARKTVENFLGIEIPYALVVDFAGFAKGVDTLGGIDVEIERSFTDSLFPNTKNGYIGPVSFKAGVEHMDGERALIYARSRYTTSDFDRARRQQKILEAFKARVRDLNLFSDIKTVNGLYDDFTSHISTNLDAGQIKRLAGLMLQVPQNQIYSSVIDPTTGMVCSFLSKEKGYHIDLCRGRTLKNIKEYTDSSFARGRVTSEQPLVEIQNATGIGGFALMASEQLTLMSFNTTATNASKLTDPDQSVIYDLTGGKKPNSLAVLQTTLSAKIGSNPPIAKTSPTPDFIVILGKNYRPPYLEVINLDPPEPEEEEEADDENGNDEEGG